MQTYKYKFQLSTVFPPEFSRWLMYELINVAQWNKDKMKALPRCVTFGKHWRVTQEIDYKITIECNQRLFSFRKGLKVNANREILIIEN